MERLVILKERDFTYFPIIFNNLKKEIKRPMLSQK